MAYLNDRVLDYGLREIYLYGNLLTVCSAEPTTYAEATATYCLGTKSSPSVGAPQAGDPTGRRVIISAFSDGVGVADGEATYYALVNVANSRLLLVDDIDTPFDVVTDEAFSFPQFQVQFPGVAA